MPKSSSLLDIVLWFIIRIPYQREQQSNNIVNELQSTEDRIIRFFVIAGILFIPLIYILSPWLNFANYYLPIWVNGLGVVTFVVSLWLFWRAHDDLGKNWSPTLQIREGHTLTTNGVYRSIRHPMYTSVLLLGIAQALLLPNWLAGLAGLVSFSIAYATRIDQEEQMLLEQFGDDYSAYKKNTKRLFPHLF